MTHVEQTILAIFTIPSITHSLKKKTTKPKTSECLQNTYVSNSILLLHSNTKQKVRKSIYTYAIDYRRNVKKINSYSRLKIFSFNGGTDFPAARRQ